MCSFSLSLQARFLAAIPVACLVVVLCDDSTEQPVVPPRNLTPSTQFDTNLEPLPDEPPVPQTQNRAPTLAELIHQEQEDARTELAQIRREIQEIDHNSGGVFCATLARVLGDPNLSRPVADGNYRLPAGSGMDALVAFLPPANNPQDEQERWAFVAVAALIASSPPGTDLDNYLELNTTRPVRQFLFPD